MAGGLGIPLTAAENHVGVPEQRPLDVENFGYYSGLAMIRTGWAAADFGALNQGWQRIGSGIWLTSPILIYHHDIAT
jgi:hypothetical protein